MLIQLNTGRVGPYCTNDAGDVIDVEDAEARRLIAGGLAEQVAAVADVVETNALAAPAGIERAAGRQPRPQPRKSNVPT